MTNACFECGEVFKNPAEARLLISAAGLSGHVTSCHVCDRCHKEARERGAPGPNVTAAGYQSANAERTRRDTVRKYISRFAILKVHGPVEGIVKFERVFKA